MAKKDFKDKKWLKHEGKGIEQPDDSYIVETKCPNCAKIFPVWIKKKEKVNSLFSEIECPKCECTLE